MKGVLFQLHNAAWSWNRKRLTVDQVTDLYLCISLGVGSLWYMLVNRFCGCVQLSHKQNPRIGVGSAFRFRCRGDADSRIVPWHPLREVHPSDAINGRCNIAFSPPTGQHASISWTQDGVRIDFYEGFPSWQSRARSEPLLKLNPKVFVCIHTVHPIIYPT